MMSGGAASFGEPRCSSGAYWRWSRSKPPRITAASFDVFSVGGSILKVGGRILAAAAVVAGLLAPASANAATVTITGDDGNPAPLTAGAPASIRNINVTAAIDVP